MIKSIYGKTIKKLIEGKAGKGFPPDLVRRAERKIAQLDAAQSLNDLRIPPSNQLEILVGDRKGQYSIRINQQWRLCFRWDGNDAYDAEIVDYH
ncbi:proteic killer suppression protein [Epibacterium ulvae]|uniref:Proteic killer suppression protein n=1 Tax=Epibacterium ulvae TaxID=1156985 RepID=A0A1G5RHI9_9RHOB|nr:type II toxin-antitoxin system RelE/ParE family toxin [Epibacterium ulvae]SCZ73555.1 proteic killer suppression protein [Epibacterium ulvae]